MGALTFRLRARDGRWHVSDLQRLLAGAHYRTRPVATVAADLLPQDRAEFAREDRRLAAAALDATRRRLADLPSGDPGLSAVRELVRHWRRKVAEFDLELAALRTRADTYGLGPPLRR